MNSGLVTQWLASGELNLPLPGSGGTAVRWCRLGDLTEIDLDPFILSGGAAYCMTLRLDRTSHAQSAILAAE